MNSEKLRDAFSYIDDKYLDLVESEQSRRKPAWYYAGVAAACLVVSLLVFTTGVMAADWFGLRSLILEKPQVDIDLSDAVTAGQYSAALSKDHDIISLSGYTDSPEAQALAEWNLFLATYDPDGTILKENDKNPEFLGSLYFVYSQEMQDKLEEITEKYGLKLHTEFNLVSAKELAYRVGGQFWTDCCDVWTGYIYENGTFQFDGTCNADDFDYQFRRSVKGTFEEVDLNIGTASDYEEWQYTTTSGEPLLLSLGPNKALIFADDDSCFITVNVLAGTEEGMSKETLEKFADSFDFGILKNVIEPDMRGDIVLPEDEERVFGTDSSSAEGGTAGVSDGANADAHTGRYGAYYDIVFYLCYNFLWPDGALCAYTYGSDYDMQDNQFAISDVDGDGQEELIVCFMASPADEFRTSIYRYDESTGTCVEELQTAPRENPGNYPGMTFYDNGMISVYLSTNPSREVCETIWPYSIYQWNKKSKSYDYVGTLYGLDKKLAVKAGEEYPTAADTDGYGTVYYLVDDTAAGSTGDSTVMSRSEYESWYEEMFGGAAAKDITYLDMTDENISGILK
jgi:hypothetical protein